MTLSLQDKEKLIQTINKGYQRALDTLVQVIPSGPFGVARKAAKSELKRRIRRKMSLNQILDDVPEFLLDYELREIIRAIREAYYSRKLQVP